MLTKNQNESLSDAFAQYKEATHRLLNASNLLIGFSCALVVGTVVLAVVLSPKEHTQVPQDRPSVESVR